jgi:hypothetical protein
MIHWLDGAPHMEKQVHEYLLGAGTYFHNHGAGGTNRSVDMDFAHRLSTQRRSLPNEVMAPWAR